MRLGYPEIQLQGVIGHELLDLAAEDALPLGAVALDLGIASDT